MKNKLKITHLILLILISSSSLISCSEQSKRIPKSKPERTKLDYEYFQGNVKDLVVLKCNEYNNDNTIKIIESSCEIISTHSFNELGQEIRSLTWNDGYNVDNVPSSSINKTYDSEGNLLIDERSVSGIFAFSSKDLYTYNKNGFVTEKIVNEDGNRVSRNVYIYDEYNCVIEELSYDKDDELKTHWKNKYNSHNQIIETLGIDNNNEVYVKYVYEYKVDSELASWSRSITYDKDGKEISRSKDKPMVEEEIENIGGLYTDDLPSAESKNVEYYSDNKIRSWRYLNSDNLEVYQVYNKKGKIIERKMFLNGDIIDGYEFNYREDGALLSYSESTSRIVGKKNYKKTTYFKLDKIGNWVEKYTIDSDGRVSDLMMQKITYY